MPNCFSVILVCIVFCVMVPDPSAILCGEFVAALFWLR